MSLAMVDLGETKVVKDFRGKDDMKRHLQDMGFVKGENVKVVGDNPSGMILLVKGVKVAINRGLASLIIVE
ncbi:MAG: FeoA family protein [Mobilitalea sp.]